MLITGKRSPNLIHMPFLIILILAAVACSENQQEPSKKHKIYHAVIMDFSVASEKTRGQVQAAMESHPMVDTTNWQDGKLTCFIVVESDSISSRASSAIMSELKDRLPLGVEPRSFAYETQVTVTGTSRGTKRGTRRAPN